VLQTLNTFKRKASFRLRRRLQVKCVLLESDDWGLERARDEEALARVVAKYGIENCSRWTTDALELPDDLDQLYHLLSHFKEKFEVGPVLTANFITHNIDYSMPQGLRFKPISEGFNFGDPGLFAKYREGIKKGVFVPQLHGFSHYDTGQLKQAYDCTEFRENFEIGFPLAKTTIKRNLWLYRGECFDPAFAGNIRSAAQVFKEVFGYHSRSFIPPHYLYEDRLGSTILSQRIELLQSSGHFLDPGGSNSLSPLFRKKRGLIYSSRNARLDTHHDYNYLGDRCIQSIERAFANRVPAVIDIHRVNFSGRYSPGTRQKTLDELALVLEYLHREHPETKFLSSDGLADMLARN
jgi:hypothetical protein